MNIKTVPDVCEVEGVAGVYLNIDERHSVLDSTPHILKLAIRKQNPKPKGRRVFIYHSWRAVIQGLDLALDKEELDAFQKECPVDLFLVGSENHVEQIKKQLNKPAIVLPYTLFIPNPPFFYRPCKKDFDVVFFCMYSEEQAIRKKAGLFLDVLRKRPSLRALWIGDYDCYERWCMEDAFNKFFTANNPCPEQWSPLWTEKERSVSWYNGSKIFPFASEIDKVNLFQSYSSLAQREGLNLMLYRGLSRNQVAHALNRSKCVAVLSSRDQWPRAITESLASGLPVVATTQLMSGLQVLDDKNSIIVEPDPMNVADAIESAGKFSGDKISRAFYENYGLLQCARTVMDAVDSIGIEWSEIVDWQRVAEKTFKYETRKFISETFS